jgi:hypothetical protein
VRAISDPDSKLHYSGGLLAEARGQLVIGAVGLALESFRTLQRQQPDSADAYAGIAACYAAMGRYDLTRTNYELALAYAPDNPALLQALASTLDKLGETEQAAQVRTEVRTAAARTAEPRLAVAPVTPLGVPRATGMTVKLSASSPPRTVIAAVDARIAAPQLGIAHVDLATWRVAKISKPALVAGADIAIARDEVPRTVLALTREPTTSKIDSLLLPAAAIDLHVASASQVPPHGMGVTTPFIASEVPEATARTAINAKPERPPAPLPTRIAQAGGADATIQQGPYLERTSLREVVLITVARPRQEARLESRSPQLPQLALIAAPPADQPPRRPVPHQLVATAAVRWLPLPYASRGQNIQLLNAARSDGLAARTRIALANRGWRKVAIGNARTARQHSLVLYSPGRWHIAARLAAQLRCKAVRVASMKSVIVLLGRDAALRRGATSRA